MQELYKNKLEILRATLTDKQLRNIHYESLYNFLQYFSSLRSETIQNQVSNLLSNYFREIEVKNYKLIQSESNAIFQNYIVKIGTFYNAQLNFKVYMEPKWALFIGLNIDLVLLILGLLRKVYYIPIVTLILTGYFGYLYLFFKKRHKIYGSGI